MGYKIDFSLLDATPNENVAPKDEVKEEVAKEENEEFSDVEFVLLSEENKEEKTPPKKGFEGVNKSVLGKEIDIDIDNKIESILNTKEEEKEEIVEEEEPKHVIKVLCVGGSEIFYKNSLEHLHEDYKDIEFIKYLASGSRTIMLTVDTLQPDIVLFAHNTQMQTPLQFWQSIQTDSASDGTTYKEKFADKRLVVLAPNDLAYEIEMKSNGIEYFVRETNPRTHEVNIKELVETLRIVYKDIEKSQEDEILQAQESFEQSVEEEAQSAEPTESVETNEAVTEEESLDAQIEAELEKSKAEAEEKPPMQKPEPQKVMPKPKKKPIVTEENYGHKVIGVYSATGGSGKTVFATNLGAILAKYSNIANTNDYKVIVLEYNLACQSMDLCFNLEADKNIGALAMELSEKVNDKGVIEIDSVELKPRLLDYIYKDKETGLDILLGISNPLEIDRIREGFTKSLIRTLKENYDVVIIDISSDIAKAPILECFKELDELYYILPMDVASIRNARHLLKFFKTLMKFRSEQIKVILNKVNPNNKEFGVDQVYSAFANDDCVPEGTIPYVGKEVLSSLNRGIPIAVEDIGNPVSQAIYSLAVGINPMLSSNEMEVELEKKEKKKKGMLGGLFGGKKKSSESVSEEPKKKKGFSLFGKKEEKKPIPEPIEMEEVQPKKTKSIFGNRKKKQEQVSMPTPQELVNATEAPKQGFFAKLASFFSRSKKKEQQEIGIKKKSKGVFALFGKKEKPQALEEGQSTRQGSSRLQSLRRPVRRK